MISDYLFKGIDNIFQHQLAQPLKTHNHRPLTKQLIKANISNVVRDKKQSTQVAHSPLQKSRIRTILQQNKEGRLRSVVKQVEPENRSPSPYQRIQSNNPQYEEENDRIVYYREQRKAIEKSRVLEKSRMGNSNCRIVQSSSYSQLKTNQKAKLKTKPSKIDLSAVIRY